MARPKLSKPSQHWSLRLLLGAVEYCASLQLAVVLIFSAAVVLASATFVESAYGTAAVKFGMYGTWWFGLLNALLGLNIFCAAAVRFPWKRHQTGFVITHVGLLTLLVGCLLSRIGGIDAQMPIYEGHSAQFAYEDSLHAEIAIEHLEGDRASEKPRVTPVQLRTGPFNWRDYDKRLGLLPWGLAGRHRAGDVLYDRDGVRLEILDFYSDSEVVDAPNLTVRLTGGAMTGAASRMGPIGGSIPLSVRQVSSEHKDRLPWGIGDVQRVGGGALVFWMVSGPEEARAFLETTPLPPEGSQAPLGTQGQVVLSIRGTIHRFLLDDHPRGQAFPLGETGLLASVEQLQGLDSDGGPRVTIKLVDTEGGTGTVELYSELPLLNIPDRARGIHGSYWFDHGQKTPEQLLRGEGSSRIDIVFVPGQEQLLYRYWNRQVVVAAGELPRDGTSIDAFQMPFARLKMAVEQLVAADRPSRKRIPVEFDKDKSAGQKKPCALFRLTLDGRSEEHWVEGMRMTPDNPPRPEEFAELGGQNRRLVVTMPFDMVDVGFAVHLDKFHKQLDPGTDQPSHYASVVDLVDVANGGKPLRKDVLITMNAPVDVRSPATGKSYRLFQESFVGPFPPHSREYQVMARDTRRDELYASVLTVNFDPGRGTKYAGCLLIVGGIATMFYMKAYFFAPRRRLARREESAPQTPPGRSTTTSHSHRAPEVVRS